MASTACESRVGDNVIRNTQGKVTKKEEEEEDDGGACNDVAKNKQVISEVSGAGGDEAMSVDDLSGMTSLGHEVLVIPMHEHPCRPE
jgi:hypothetical protein